MIKSGITKGNYSVPLLVQAPPSEAADEAAEVTPETEDPAPEPGPDVRDLFPNLSLSSVQVSTLGKINYERLMTVMDQAKLRS